MQWFKQISLTDKISGLNLFIAIIGLLTSSILSWYALKKDDPVPAFKAKEESTKIEPKKHKEITIRDISEIGGLDFSNHMIYQSLSLSNFANGIDGTLLILIDKRIAGIKGTIKKDAYKEYQELEIKVDDNNQNLDKNNLHEAYLLMVNEDLKIVYSEKLGRENARIDRIFPYKDKSKPVYVLTRDYSIDIGSYNGPMSYFFEVKNNSLQYLFADSLMLSLKSKWYIVEKNGMAEILYKTCRPAFDNKSEETSFVIKYAKYFQKNGSWKKIVSEKEGFWEDDEHNAEEDIAEFYDKGKKNNWRLHKI